MGQAHVVSIGTGPADPRAWVPAAYKLRLGPGHGYYPGTRP